MKRHFNCIKNEIAYFRKVVENMDLDDIKKEKKHNENNVHYDEFLDENGGKIFQIVAESKYQDNLHWIDLIENEKLYKAIEFLSDEEKYFITILFYENRTQKELAKIYQLKESTVFYKINKIIRKIKKYMSDK